MRNPKLLGSAAEAKAKDPNWFAWFVITVGRFGKLHEPDPDDLVRILETIKWIRKSCFKSIKAYKDQVPKVKFRRGPTLDQKQRMWKNKKADEVLHWAQNHVEGLLHWAMRPSLRTISMARRRKLRLLSLDGGGIRGMSSLLILQRIMNDLKTKRVIAPGTLPCQYFDMIGGTSTGGLIAILLGRFGMSVDKCITLYEQLGEKIFSASGDWGTDAKFSSSVFEEVLQDIVKKYSPDTESYQPGGCRLVDTAIGQPGFRCPIFVVAVDQNKANYPDRATLFRSYRVPGDHFGGVRVVDAARATTAAPTYFTAKCIFDGKEDKYFIDGGIGHNNPVLHLIEEAKQNFPSTDIGCVVSIGTGFQQGRRLGRERLITSLGLPLVGRAFAKLDTIKLIEALATSSEYVHSIAKNKFRGTGIYYRFNCPEGGKIKLYEYKKTAEVSDLTKLYLNKVCTVKDVEACILQLHIAGESRCSDGNTFGASM